MGSNALMGGVVSGLCAGVFCFLFAVIRDVFATDRVKKAENKTKED